MAYTDRLAVFDFQYFSGYTGSVVADNSDLAFFMIPANREIEIQNAMAYVAAASDGADFIELVKEDDTVICKFALQTTGKKAAVDSDGSTATTFPQRIAPQSTSAVSLLKLRLGGAIDTSCQFAVQVHISGLNAR